MEIKNSSSAMILMFVQNGLFLSDFLFATLKLAIEKCATVHEN